MIFVVDLFSGMFAMLHASISSSVTIVRVDLLFGTFAVLGAIHHFLASNFKTTLVHSLRCRYKRLTGFALVITILVLNIPVPVSILVHNSRAVVFGWLWRYCQSHVIRGQGGNRLNQWVSE